MAPPVTAASRSTPSKSACSIAITPASAKICRGQSRPVKGLTWLRVAFSGRIPRHLSIYLSIYLSCMRGAGCDRLEHLAHQRSGEVNIAEKSKAYRLGCWFGSRHVFEATHSRHLPGILRSISYIHTACLLSATAKKNKNVAVSAAGKITTAWFGSAWLGSVT